MQQKKKRKRLYLFSLTKLIVLCFDVSNQEENQFGVNQDFTINNFLCKPRQWSYFFLQLKHWKVITILLPFSSTSFQSKKNPVQTVILSALLMIVLIVIGTRYFIVFIQDQRFHIFFNSTFSHSKYLYQYFETLLQCPELYYQVVFLLCLDVSNV